MGLMKRLFISVVIPLLAYYVGKHILLEPPFPSLDPDPWWGPGTPKPEDPSIKLFKIDIPDQDVDDLENRIDLPLRLTSPLEDANFTYGMSHYTLEKIVMYWRNEYSWKQREERLNQYPHYKTQIEGLDIHFMRASPQKTSNVKVVPLLLIHGWPGSFVEFYNILPLLTTPRDGSNVVFEVICPSIPGYGFSQGSAKQGLGVLETAQIFLKLMKRLDYEKFYLQGGDWGAFIASIMATVYPENVLGIHLNNFYSSTLGTSIKCLLGYFLPSGILMTAEESEKLYSISKRFNFMAVESGHLHIQATKPDTIGAALDQTPIGLAAYILEKFSTWTNRSLRNFPDGGLLQKDFPIPLDQLLDNICIYWFTGTITSSMRFYAENMSHRYNFLGLHNIPCRVPAGFASFPQELLNHPRSFLVHKYYDIVSFTHYPQGGHFAAIEQPTFLAADVHKFVTAVEERLQRKKH